MAAYFGSCFFPRKLGKVAFFFAVCALAGISTMFLELWGNAPGLKLLFALLLHTVWIIIVFHPNFILSLFTAALLLSYWWIMDSLFLMCVSLFGKNNTEIMVKSPYAYYLMCFAAKSLEVLGIVILSAMVKKRFQVYLMHWPDWLRIIFFPTATLLVSIQLLHMYYIAPELAKNLVFSSCVLLLADVMSVFLLDHLEKQQVAIRDNVILQQDLKTERESISAWVAAYREERKRSHDFQNQLSVLRGLVEENAPSERFLQYLDSLLNINLPATRYIDTNRPVADVLLSQKSVIARNKGIPFQMQLDDLSAFPLSDDELVVVLANLLDNAIEACERIPEETSRYILIKVQCTPDVTYLHIENPTVEPVTIKKNQVVASRKKSNAHGFGLQNVATILGRHQALFVLNYQETDGVFSFSAQILSNQ